MIDMEMENAGKVLCFIIFIACLTFIILSYMLLKNPDDSKTIKNQIEINQKLTKELQIKFSNLSADVQKLKEK